MPINFLFGAQSQRCTDASDYVVPAQYAEVNEPIAASVA